MFDKFLTVFKIPELRRKIWLTLALLCVYRLGYYITLPNIDQAVIKQNMDRARTEKGLAQTFQLVQLFSASDFGNATVFGLGIMPYISASIILQLLASVWPPLEKLQKEGEVGRKKINEYTRYLTVGLCFFQSIMWLSYLESNVGANSVYTSYGGFYPNLVNVITMTAGSIFLMWIGEQIDEYGVGNGISLLIMAGILARVPAAIRQLFSDYIGSAQGVHLRAVKAEERIPRILERAGISSRC